MDKINYTQLSALPMKYERIWFDAWNKIMLIHGFQRKIQGKTGAFSLL